MKFKKSILAVLPIFAFVGSVLSQTITFHSPVSWITLRDSKILAKTLIDTAEVKKNNITLTLSKVVNGKKTKVYSKKFKADDYSHEYELGDVKKQSLGGKDYLKIEWKVSGTDKKGTIQPFGIVKIDTEVAIDKIKCKKVESIKLASLKESVKDADYSGVGSKKFAVVWNNDKLGILFKKDKKQISFSFDGKNGKNAFLSYSDRIITYYGDNDSLATEYYKRSVTDKGVEYKAKDWNQEITKEVNDDLVLIIVPWFDLCIQAVDDRIFGFASFVTEGKKVSSLPIKAVKEMPGTWGNVVLAK